MEVVKPVQKEILKVLKKEGVPMTAYQVAKKIGVSWSTAHYHLMELAAMGKLIREEETRFGMKKVFYKLNPQSSSK